MVARWIIKFFTEESLNSSKMSDYYGTNYYFLSGTKKFAHNTVEAWCSTCMQSSSDDADLLKKSARKQQFISIKGISLEAEKSKISKDCALSPS